MVPEHAHYDTIAHLGLFLYSMKCTRLVKLYIWL